MTETKKQEGTAPVISTTQRFPIRLEAFQSASLMTSKVVYLERPIRQIFVSSPTDKGETMIFEFQFDRLEKEGNTEVNVFKLVSVGMGKEVEETEGSGSMPELKGIQ